MRPMHSCFSWRRSLGFIALSLAVVACSDSNPPDTDNDTPVNPTPRPRILLTASADNTIADGATPVTITATVLGADGEPAADGTAITFTTDLGSFLEVSAATAELTISDGTAVVSLVSSVAGTASIAAEALGVVGGIQTVFALPATGGDGDGGGDGGDGDGDGGSGNGTSASFTGTLFLAVDNPFVPTGFKVGGSSNDVKINGRAKDPDNTPYDGGAAVTWSVVGPANVDSSLWGFVPDESPTDNNGNFSGIYTAAEVEGDYVVIAWLGSATAYTVIQVIDLSPATVLISASPSGLDADGSSQAVISVTVLDQTGASVIDGTPVTISLVSGGGTLSDVDTVTTGGKASATYTAGNTGGVATILASAGGVTSTINISLTSLDPNDVNVSISPTTVEQASQATVTATVLDGNNQPVPEGTNITFSIGSQPVGGDAVLTPTQTSTDEDGRASVQFAAGSVTGVYAIVADAGNGVTDYALVSVITPGVGSIQFVSATPSVIGVKGSNNGGNSALPELSNLVFEVLTTSGQPVPDGTVVTFSLQAPYGTTLLTTSAQTIDGRVTARIRSGTVSGLARVNAQTVFGNQIFNAYSSNVVVQAGPPASEHVSISLEPEDWVLPGMAIDGLDICYNIIIGDRFNNPVPDGTVVFFTGESGVIGEGGQASAQTVNGQASICGVTANPRPYVVIDPTAVAAQVDFSSVLPTGALGHSWPAVQFAWRNRVVDFLAQVLGEESFIDVDGDGIRDPGEAFADVGEPFVDLNYDFTSHSHDGIIPLFGGSFTEAIEPFWDTVTADGQYNIGNGTYDAAVTIGAHGPQSVWTDQSFSVQYAPSQFIDVDNDALYDPGSDIPVVAGPGVTSTAAVTICTQNALTDGNLLLGDVGGFASGFLSFEFWAGDSAGVSPFNGGTISFSSDGNIDVLTDDITLGSGAAAVALTGLRTLMTVKANNETAAPELFATVSIEYPEVEGVGNSVEQVVGVCVATIEQ